MVTSYRLILRVEPITEGVVGRAADTAMGRVVDGMCWHWHDGKKGNWEIVEDRPWILPFFYRLLICWSSCMDQPHSDSLSVSMHRPAPHDVTYLVMNSIFSILSRTTFIPFLLTAHISPDHWLTLLSFLANVFLFWFFSFPHVVFFLFQMFVNMVCAQGATVYIPIPTSCSSSLSLSISSSRQFCPLHQRLLRLLPLMPRQVSSTCSFILSYLYSPLDHHL